jgi:hypothetical protein
MNYLMRIRVHILVAIVGFYFAPAEARLTREYSTQEKVMASDVIFIGTVASLHNSSLENHTFIDYARIAVEHVIKGEDLSASVDFITRGTVQELDPHCCQIGHTYIFFARRGYDSFYIKEKIFHSERIEKDRFLSSTNGSFGTYELSGGIVENWPTTEPSPAGIMLPQVLEELNRIISGQ